MRVVIRVVLEDATEEKALELRKKIALLLEGSEGGKIETTFIG